MGKCMLNVADSVFICGKEYGINTDFLTWIKIEHLVFDYTQSTQIRLAQALTLAYPELPPDPVQAVEGIIWFYSCGESKSKTEDTSELPAYDLYEDFDYVWAAFRGEFGIDLTCEKIHWWQFKVLLACLSDECRFAKIVGYRKMDTSRIKDKETRMFYERMKKQYALESHNDPKLREIRLTDSLEALFE